MPEPKRHLKVFLCHTHADRDAIRALPEGTRLTTPALHLSLTGRRQGAGGAREDGVDAWLYKEKLLPRQAWELEICKAMST